jgi:hypothetical protein
MSRKLYAPDPIRKTRDVPTLVRQPFKAEVNYRMKTEEDRMETEEDRLFANDKRLLNQAIKILGVKL